MRSLTPFVTYTLGNSLYVPLTCRCNSFTLPETRGPNFLLPPQVVASLLRLRDTECNTEQWSKWCMDLDGVDTPQKLPPPLFEPIPEYPSSSSGTTTIEPQIKDLFQEIQEQAVQTEGEFSSIVISGEGEPTMRLDDLLVLAKMLTSSSSSPINLPPVRLTTNGLAPSDDTAKMLKNSGVSQVSVALMTSDKDQYVELMNPQVSSSSTTTTVNDMGHSIVCNFIQQSIKVGLDVEVTAVDRDEIDKSKVESLAHSLGVSKAVRWRPYFG